MAVHRYGLGEQLVASKLRKEIADFVAKNPSLKIADTALSDWVRHALGGPDALQCLAYFYF